VCDLNQILSRGGSRLDFDKRITRSRNGWCAKVQRAGLNDKAGSVAAVSGFNRADEKVTAFAADVGGYTGRAWQSGHGSHKPRVRLALEGLCLARGGQLTGKETDEADQALVEEALSDLVEKHRKAHPLPHVMAAYLGSHEKFGSLYKKLVE